MCEESGGETHDVCRVCKVRVHYGGAGCERQRGSGALCVRAWGAAERCVRHRFAHHPRDCRAILVLEDAGGDTRSGDGGVGIIPNQSYVDTYLHSTERSTHAQRAHGAGLAVSRCERTA